jgi:hypothetical protein
VPPKDFSQIGSVARILGGLGWNVSRQDLRCYLQRRAADAEASLRLDHVSRRQRLPAFTLESKDNVLSGRR